MNRIGKIAVVAAVLACSCSAQTKAHKAKDSTILWSPPIVDWGEESVPATAPKEMIATLLVAGMPVTLEETKVEDVRERLGGTIGSQGDASEALAWLCFHGGDKTGRWMLWLTSGELAGLTIIDGFDWSRLSAGGIPDHRCRSLPKNSDGIELPIQLHLGMTEQEVRQTLGAPSDIRNKTLIFNHEHKTVIRNEPYTVSNNVSVVFRSGVVWAIEVARTTSN